jgi:hypothetical protein
MLETAASTADAKAADAERALTDGWHLVIEALRLNGLNTIYGVPGIPITDLGRLAQAAGMRVISFRARTERRQRHGHRRLFDQRSPAFASRCQHPAF